MTIAASTKARVAYVPETAFGTAPTTPTFAQMRRTSGNLATKKTTIESEEMNLDARTRAVYQTGQDVSGSYGFDFSYGSFDDLIAAALQSAWVANSISDGVAQSSFLFEETVDTGGGTFAFNRFSGCEVGSLGLTLASRAGVKGSVTLMGQSETTDTAILAGATYTAPNANPVETAVTVGALSVLGLIPAPKLKTLALTIERGLRIRDTVGSLYSSEFGISTSKVSGNFDAYFESNALYQQVLSHGSGALTIPIGSVSGKKYLISLPTIQLLDGVRTVGTRNSDVMVNIQFEAIGTAASPLISITRALT